MRNRPNALKKGDTVAITCPAKKLPYPIDKAVHLLESWGLHVVVGETTKLAHYQFAGTDKQRIQEFQSFLNNPEIKAIFAARGGYGCIRIVDQLHFEPLQKYPKWIIGFSDITVLHSHLHAQYQLETIHAQMPLNIPEASKKSLNTLKKALFGGLKSYQWKTKNTENKSGTAEGELIGGNLSILTMLEHSISEMDFKNKILFIEDVGEAHYAIDRMLYQLLRSGKMAQISGLIVGGFSRLRDTAKDFGQTVEAMIEEKTKDFKYPIAYQFPAGHVKNNCAFILGKKISLDVHHNYAKLTYL